MDYGIHLAITKTLQGDAGRFVQILVNFMLHSLKQLEKNGTVRVHVKLDDFQGRMGSLYQRNDPFKYAQIPKKKFINADV